MAVSSFAPGAASAWPDGGVSTASARDGERATKNAAGSATAAATKGRASERNMADDPLCWRAWRSDTLDVPPASGKFRIRRALFQRATPWVSATVLGNSVHADARG